MRPLLGIRNGCKASPWAKLRLPQLTLELLDEQLAVRFQPVLLDVIQTHHATLNVRTELTCHVYRQRSRQT
jgi:hypothetical protein